MKMINSLVNAPTELTSVETGSIATTQIHAAEPVEEVAAKIVAQPNMVTTPLDQILRSDILLGTYTWAGTVANFTEISAIPFPARTYLTMSTIQDILSYSRGIRATYQLMFRFIAPGNLTGSLLVSLLPRAYTDNPTPYVDCFKMADPFQLDSSYIVDASNPLDLIVDLPPIHAEQYQIIRSFTSGKHWALRLTVINKLRNILTATSPAMSIQIYCKVKSYELHGLTYESAVIANAAKFVKKVGDATSGVLSATANLASVMGYSKEPLTDTIKTQNSRFHIMSSDAPDPSEILAVNTHAKVTEPAEPEDNMLLDFLTGHESLVIIKDLTAGQYTRIPICIGNNGSTIGDKPTVANYICRPFAYYRVQEFIYTIRIFSHPSVRGTVEVYYVPYFNNAWTVSSASMAASKKIIIPLEGSSETEVSFPWIASSPVLPNFAMVSNSASNPDPTNGMFVLYVYSVTSPLTTSETIGVCITQKHKGLAPVMLTDFDFNAANTLFSDIVMDHTVISSESTKCPALNYRKVVMGTSDNFDVFAHLSGDPIVSIRPLLQRPSSVAAFLPEDFVADEDIKVIRKQFAPKISEVTRVFNARGFNNVSGVDPDDARSHMSLAAYYLAMFVGYKGSTRISVNGLPGLAVFQPTGSGTPIVLDYEHPGYNLTPLITPAGSYTGSDWKSAHPISEPGSSILGGSNTLDKSTRTTFQYDQPLDFVSSTVCADETLIPPLDQSWMFYMQPWVQALDKGKGNSLTTTYISRLRINILVSAGDDIKAYIFRGVPVLITA